MKNPTKTETRPEPATAEERVKALAIQREFVKRIRVELGDRKLLAKHAKACLESALFDLESMTDSSAPGRVYPGVLVIDEETGRPKSYKSLADLAAEEERSKRAEQDERESLFPTKGKAKAEALETVDPGTGEVLPRKLKKFVRDRDAEARKGTR